MNSINDKKYHIEPVSFIQHQYAFMKSIFPQSPAYNIPFSFILTGKLNVKALEQALNHIIKMNEIFRTSIVTINGQLMQNIYEILYVKIPVKDIRSLPEDLIDKEVEKIERNFVQESFDGIMLRVLLILTHDTKYRFLLVFHNSIVDYDTCNYFFQKLGVYYRYYSNGESPLETSISRQYSDYVTWECEFVNSDRSKEMLNYWENKLKNNKPITLPRDRISQGMPTQNGDIVPFAIPHEQHERLLASSDKDALYLFRLMLSAYFVLLHRLSGQSDLTVGVPFANREKSDFRETMGPLTNILPLYVYIDNEMTIGGIMGQIHEAMRGAYRNQELPFEYIVHNIDKKRTNNNNPLFQVGFENWPMSQLNLQDIKVKARNIHHGDARLDLFLSYWETENSIEGWFEYNSDLIDTPTICRIMRNYLSILSIIPQVMNEKVGNLLLIDDESKQLLYDWNQTNYDFHDERCLPELIEHQVDVNPESTAVIYEDQSMTYKILNNRANQVAQKLQEMGVGPDTLVGISIERSFELIIGLCGILKAGGAYVPIDKNLPKKRIEFLLENTGISILVSRTVDDSEFETYDNITILNIDTEFATNDKTKSVSNNNQNNPNRELTLDNLAYVIYTSGSTGTPKGVMIPHRGICNRLHWMQKEYQLTPQDRVLQKTSFSFDVSVWEFFWPLITGSTIVLAKSGGHRINNYLISLINEQHVTIMHFVPSVLHTFLETPGSEKCTSLRDVICSGESLTLSIQKLFFERFSHNIRLHNLYGPTEASIDVSYWQCDPDYTRETVPIGKPITNTQLYVLDNRLHPLPIGVKGELYIGGVGLAKGYLNRPDLTKEMFIPNPFSQDKNARMYKTGDIARWLPDGVIDFIGRNDNQIQLYGLRIELEEIESKLSSHPGVTECVVKVSNLEDINKQLIAFIVPNGNLKQKAPDIIRDILRKFLLKHLPPLMVPYIFITVDSLPHTTSGKINRNGISTDDIMLPESAQRTSARTGSEKTIAEVWKTILSLDKIGIDDNFFDLGGNSILIPQVVAELFSRGGYKIVIIDLFKYPTIRSLGQFIEANISDSDSKQRCKQSEIKRSRLNLQQKEGHHKSSAIAIIGMAGRFPGANTIDEFWNNISNGVESLRFFDEDELLESGITQEEIDNPLYVRGKGYVEEAEYFDAAFFNISPRDAEMIDPQQRCFLECSWEALEDAGYIPETFEGMIGVFGGVGVQFYLMKNILRNSRISRSFHSFTDLNIELGNDKDQTTTRVSYKLNLKGPSINIQSSCSTSLVAVNYACRSLLDYQCDIALGGGAYISVPRKSGYLYAEGFISSSDGHVRTFDEKASGTNFSDGCGVVVLKRLEDALKDKDHIYSIIKSIAVNHDGSDKIGYTAPSIKGQAAVIKLAHSFADISPDTISYIETHGTGTILGDPIEIAGLKEAFKSSKRYGNYCAIGSVKPNIGHSDAAAGVISLMKTALALYHRILPVSINFKKPNPKLEIEDSPFFVNTETHIWNCLRDENGNEIPRRAGVSNFGIGGTNVHTIVEEIPQVVSSLSNNPSFLLPISAKSPVSLNKFTEKLADFIQRHKEISLADTAYTLQTGRSAFEHRRFVVCHNHDTAVERLRELPTIFTMKGQAPEKAQQPVFMFSGQGSQYPDMGKALYESNEVYRKYIDICADHVQSILSFDIRDKIFADKHDRESVENIAQTSVTQPALFMVEYSMAQAWMSIGVTPAALIGHSIGEYTAACLAKVMSLEDALFLICHRGRLMQSVSPGSMLAVRLSENKIKERLQGNLTIGVINTAGLCVVSGSHAEIDVLEKTLTEEDIGTRRLHTSHAFHSEMMEPILDDFVQIAEKITLNDPQIPFLSNVTGTWITQSEAIDPHYWAQHLRKTVRFADGISTLIKNDYRVFLEVGPGNTLATIARQHAALFSYEISTIPSQPHPKQSISGYDFWLSSIGNLWIQNVSIDWNSLYTNERRRISLPTYAFDKMKHWIDPDANLLIKKDQIYHIEANKEASNISDEAVKNEEDQSSNLESIIKLILSDILGYDSIIIEDEFYELGLDSMAVIEFAAKVKEILGVEIPLDLFTEDPTVADIINSISKIKS